MLAASSKSQGSLTRVNGRPREGAAEARRPKKFRRRAVIVFKFDCSVFVIVFVILAQLLRWVSVCFIHFLETPHRGYDRRPRHLRVRGGDEAVCSDRWGHCCSLHVEVIG